MWKKITQLIYGKDCELRERMFRTIILVGGIATIVACVEIFLVMEISTAMLCVLLFLILAMGICLFVTFRYHKYDLVTILLGVVIVSFVMPLMFCMSAALESGASVWLALGILYIFIMFSGKKLVFFMILCTVSYGLTYWLTYTFPEVIIPMPSKAVSYFDAFFSVIAVGCIAGLILKAHMRVFEAEHQQNILQKEELERSRDSRNVFFANMSHEIRTPINTIIGLNELIMRDNPDEQTGIYAQDIQVASKMLLNQVNDILDLSQMEMKRMRIVPVNYRTVEMLGDLAEMIRIQADKKKLQLLLDIDPNLPSALLGDEKRLKQVILNLLDNAVKYTEEGAVTLSAHCEDSAEGECVLKIQVADTGIGIRKEDMEHLYDSFNRVDEKRNTRIMGSGLGLAITKQLVDLMDGELTVDSIYTKGSVFTVTVKQKIVDEKPIGVVDLMRRGAAEGEKYQPGFEAPEARVLIVDDNKMNAMVATKLLEGTKVQLDVAHSGAECLERTRKKFYHVILMDYMMPGMSGTETLHALRNQENGLCRNSSVIVLTANNMSGASEMYKEQGFDGYVEKPVFGKVLEMEVLKLLPADIIEYINKESVDAGSYSPLQKITMKKRKKIYITADCVCDIPPELLEKYDIKLMYLYIQTPHGRFADTREIDSDSLRQYVSGDSSIAYASSVTVEEYEEFFAEALTQAERVIHIAMASGLGSIYDAAVAAAKGFDHVRIIDSGQFSCGHGLITLHAARLASEGKSAREICEEIERMKGRVVSRFVMPGADISYQHGRIKSGLVKLCRTFQLKPYATVKQKKLSMICLLGGSLEGAWKQAIRLQLRRKRKVCKDVVFITHVGCSVKQQEWLKEEVLKCVPFERVIIQNASFSTSCNAGLESIGIAYYGL